MKTFGLTRLEQKAILLLVVSFLVGVTVKAYRFRVLGQKNVFSAYSSQKDSLDIVFQEKSGLVNQGAAELLILKETDALLMYPVNINTDSLDRLIMLPCIGPALGKRIITYRKAHGTFRRKEGLMQVKGIGEKTFQKISKYISI